MDLELLIHHQFVILITYRDGDLTSSHDIEEKKFLYGQSDCVVVMLTILFSIADIHILILHVTVSINCYQLSNSGLFLF